jgi:hypothetical protein
MNWFKRIFCSQEEFVGHIETPRYRKDPFPLEIVKKDVSEPVLSFIKCVKNNPKRFEVNRYNSHASSMAMGSYNIRPYDFYAFTVWDKEINRGWFIKGQFFYAPGGDLSKKFEEATFLTDTEKSWLISGIQSIYSARRDTYNEIIKSRKERNKLAQRNSLKEIYK